MKKKILVCLCTLVCVAAVAAQENLAILPFTGGSAREGETIAELFSFNEALNQVFSIIPRTTINRAVGVEQNFQMGTGMTDPDTIAAIGRQVGANYVVAGNITKLGNRNFLIISILKIDELRQIAGAIQTYDRIEEIQDKLPGMARNIIAAARLAPSQLNLDKLAVVPIETGENSDPRVADTLAQILSIHLIQSGKYRVYPRTATLAQVQAEYNNQLSGVTADEQIVNMGRGDNPRLILSVASRQLGAQNMFNASIINLETGVQMTGGFVNYITLDDGIEAMETLSQKLTGVSENLPLNRDPDPSWYQDTTARAEAAIAEKPAPAVRRSGGGAFGYGVLNLAAGLGSFIQGDWGGGGLVILTGYGAAAGLIFWELSLKYEDDLAGIPGTVGLGVAGVTVLYGFIRPVVFQKNQRLAAITDRIHLAVVPGNRGEEAVQLSYTLRF